MTVLSSADPLRTPPDADAPRRRPVPRTVLLRVALLVALLVAGFVLLRWTPVGNFLTEERMVALLGALRRAWWSPLALIGLYAVVSPLGMPVSPILVGGGAVFGFLIGSLYNMVGLLVGALLSYYLAKLLGRDFIVHIAGQRLRRVEQIFQRHGFWPLVQTRFLPIPFVVTNFGAALAGITPMRFLVATTVGLVPATLLHTYFVSKLFTTTGQERLTYFIGWLLAMALFNVVIGLPSLRRWWQRRRRLREETAQREAGGENRA